MNEKKFMKLKRENKSYEMSYKSDDFTPDSYYQFNLKGMTHNKMMVNNLQTELEIGNDFNRRIRNDDTANYIISYHIILYYIISYHIISYQSYHIILYHITSYYIIPHHITSYYIISYHNTSYHITSYHTILYHIISYYIISYHIISHHIISYHTILYHIISHHIISFHIILFYFISYHCFAFYMGFFHNLILPSSPTRAIGAVRQNILKNRDVWRAYVKGTVRTETSGGE